MIAVGVGNDLTSNLSSKPVLNTFLVDKEPLTSAISFHKNLFGTSPGPITSLISIAVPFSVDWEGVTLLPGLILPSAVSAGHQSVSNTLLLEFPDVENWLEDDFTQAMIAQIDLAEGALNCDRLILCVDREASSVLRSLQYVGFSVIRNDIALPHLGLTIPATSSDFCFLQYLTERSRQ